MKIALSVFTFAAFAFVQVQSEDENRVPINKSDLNPRDFATLGNRSYYFSPTDVDAKQALQFCNDIGMTLVSIETEEEDVLIWRYLYYNGLNEDYWTSGRHLVDIYYWTSTGQILTYAPWCCNRPKSPTSYESCISIGTLGFYHNKWYDWSCTILNRFICEER